MKPRSRLIPVSLVISNEITQEFIIFSFKITRNRRNCHSQSSQFIQILKCQITFSLNSRKFFTLSVCIYQTNKESEWTSCNPKTQIKTKALNFVKSKNGEKKCPPQKIMSQVCHENGKSKNGKLPNLNFAAKSTYNVFIANL